MSKSAKYFVGTFLCAAVAAFTVTRLSNANAFGRRMAASYCQPIESNVGEGGSYSAPHYALGQWLSANTGLESQIDCPVPQDDNLFSTQATSIHVYGHKYHSGGWVAACPYSAFLGLEGFAGGGCSADNTAHDYDLSLTLTSSFWGYTFGWTSPTDFPFINISFSGDSGCNLTYVGTGVSCTTVRGIYVGN